MPVARRWQIAWIAALPTMLWLTALAPSLESQQRPTTGTLSGSVVNESGGLLAGASVQIVRTDGAGQQAVITDPRGTFVFVGLSPGLYNVTTRRIGFRVAERSFIRIVPGQPAEIRVMLSASPTQLSTVTVRVGSASIDPATSEIARRLEVADVKLVPMTRDATNLVNLVPGARNGLVWGGAGAAANNYQLDGVAVNHPGVGGDFLAPSIDWIEALEVRGLGAGAEHGNFQGGIVNAVTKSGTNNRQGAMQVHYVSPALTSSNIQGFEEGAEQAMRRELSGEIRGPVVRDRLFYFVAGQVTDRGVQIPDLRTGARDAVRDETQDFHGTRGIAKLTYLPGPRDRIDALAGRGRNGVERAELNGLDDAAASLRVDAPSTVYSLAWTRTNATGAFDFRLAGFDSHETRNGYLGADVPAVQLYRRGRQPSFQNAAFNERLEPSSLGGTATWKKQHSLFGRENRIVAGAELTRGSWRQERIRNGGLTWRPYPDPATKILDPSNPMAWVDVASEWGGEIRLQSDVEDAAIFVQDYFSPSPALTITPGLRYGRWRGWLTPAGAGERFLAVQHQAVDPRLGVAWDVSGRNSFVIKAHWGRYHQGMSSVFFDRAAGGNVYSNSRFYYQGPQLSDPRQTYTAAERDAMRGQFEFGPNFAESILNEAGRVENYRQPYVQQAVLSAEKTFGQRWKAEISYTNRENRDVAGIVDRNIAENYSRLTGVAVRDRVTQQVLFDQFGEPLVLPTVWVSNRDLRSALVARQASLGLPLPPVPGYSYGDIDRLTWNPDIVLTTVGSAKRRFDQISVSVRTEQGAWSAFGAVTATRLAGNVPGLTGFGSNGTSFTAGPAVRPNEATLYDGLLPGAPAVDSKLWLTGNLPYAFKVGAFATFSLGEYFTPQFEVSPRVAFRASDGTRLEDELFRGVLGQTIFLEQRGTRNYLPRANLDLRLERVFSRRGLEMALGADLFNALGSSAIAARNLTVNDQVPDDPSSLFAAPRLRVSPLSMQVNARVSF